MITATTQAEALTARLRQHAARLASDHGEELARTRKTARLNWHSARFLWPDLGWD